MPVSLHPDLFHILRGYAALIPPRCLQFPPHLSTQLIHDVLLEHVLLSPHFQLYPPSRQYQKAFWKCIISHLENKLESETEIDPRIYEHYLDLMNASALNLDGQRLPGQGPPSQSYVTHFWRPDDDRTTSPSAPVDLGAYQTTTLLESRTLAECGTTGLRTWLASLVLAQYLIHNPALVQRKRILELGSGIGFLGSVVASLQLLASESDTSGFASPGMVCLSDVNDVVLLRCRDNVHLPCNRSASHTGIRCCFLDWSAALDPDGIAPLTSLLHDDLDADLILGADIVFDPHLIPALVATLCLALRGTTRPRSAIIALTTRNPATMQKFTDTISNCDLILERIDTPLQDSMFMEPVEGSGSANNGVNIFKVSSSLPVDNSIV